MSGRMTDNYHAEKPLDLRRNVPFAKLPEEQTTTESAPPVNSPLTPDVAPNVQHCDSPTVFGATEENDTQTENECGKTYKRSQSYMEMARHPLKRRRIEFLNQMGYDDSSSDVRHRPNEIDMVLNTSKVPNVVTSDKTLKTSPSDTTLSLSWTGDSSKLRPHVQKQWFRQDNFTPEPPVLCPKREQLDVSPQIQELSIRTLINTSEKNQPKWTLGPPVDENEKNVSNNCILEYINRCKITKNPLPSTKDRKYWDYSDFQDIQRQKVSNVEDEKEQTEGVKMSALDFLLSKFLMGKSDDAFTSRNEHANQVLEGKKKGTLNLMDVMELQVEMGLV